MKTRFVSAVALLFCCAIFAIVGIFGYSRYMAAKAEDAAFRAKLLNTGPPVLGARMPGGVLSSQIAGSPSPAAEGQ